jgi:glyoxylase-like metal-dependent hydrolase (beta-lactamase superfamily II)
VADTGREAPDDALHFYRRAGWSEIAIENYRARFGNFGKHVHSLPDSFRRLCDGDWLQIGANRWQVIVGRGHSPEHACLYCPGLKLLISGDQVLPRISSNVSVHPTEPDADPMSDWLASLDRLQALVPDDVLVLPAHNECFRGLHTRIEALRRGQATALLRLRRTLAPAAGAAARLDGRGRVVPVRGRCAGSGRGACQALDHRARLARLRADQAPPGTDSYWFPDYLGDLDACSTALEPDGRSTCSATAWAATW